MSRTAAPRIVLTVCALLALIAAGVGWLYLLRDASALAVGPSVPEALPLQRLAHGDAQPLLRLVVAWLPAGLVAGWLLRPVSPVLRATIAFACVFAVLIVAGAALDGVTASETLMHHLGDQPSRAATWIAAGLVALGSLVIPSVPRQPAPRPDTSADATRLGVERTAAP